MLDYGFRSACCGSPIRLGTRTVKKTKQTVKVWVCCKCQSFDCDIVPTGGGKSQEPESFAD
jgi:streptolysin S family bacteriocin protoxin